MTPFERGFYKRAQELGLVKKGNAGSGGLLESSLGEHAYPTALGMPQGALDNLFGVGQSGHPIGDTLGDVAGQAVRHGAAGVMPAVAGGVGEALSTPFISKVMSQYKANPAPFATPGNIQRSYNNYDNMPEGTMQQGMLDSIRKQTGNSSLPLK